MYQPSPQSDIIESPHPSQRGGRGKRRSGASTPRSTRNKRIKTEEEQEEIMSEPVVQIPQAPPPDADMVLKYTYGVNAWKHWVAQKNEELQQFRQRRGR
jgi:hypothetical protein